ncbi:MAG: bifunctional phosphoribosyl-AMP cyclohydrolase/phosphoribosyl-ATP diphosphatase HisIE [Bacteroidota bacterium]|nr:bifunctional phosphoribosyl-AMP cyclohydrolase/phosphoribosyl-ATP diphosphatase HisIE [Bacteroidota bacterium]MDP3146613.1 bifunctional phosphoribosyl-AMP cyclohydrolase/phosphoribosyl-ATP diphosphatase HisIE [Bacteroidota bacterium]MDP3556186.1 bifunctional phosphoribosyl-AMP cyclohydrolase/phosphoribosyl-ATP diphosphatase HisIE [Bacteroidota bacterium]
MKPNFTKSNDGLIPVIIQDNITNRVLMLGYMNEEAFEKTKKENRVTFFSRSKNRLWTKGEESKNYLNVNSILLDCDEDTLLIKATPEGPVCHTGEDTCFKEKNRSENFLFELENIIRDRKINPTDSSYTSTLFKKGINKIAQKVGEEAVELVIESKDNNQDLFLNEAADLLYHYLILLQAKNASLTEITTILKERNKKEN